MEMEKGLRGGRPDVSRSCLLLDGFDLHDQTDVLWEAPIDAVVHAELGAVDRGFKISTAHFALDHGVFVAIEVVGLQNHGQGFAQQCQSAAHFRHFVVGKREFVRHEFCSREFARVKQIGTLQMLVERGGAGVDGRRVNHHFNLAGFGCAVKLNRAFFFVKTTAVGGRAKVADFKRGKGVGAVDRILCGLGLGSARQKGRSSDGEMR